MISASTIHRGSPFTRAPCMPPRKGVHLLRMENTHGAQPAEVWQNKDFQSVGKGSAFQIMTVGIRDRKAGMKVQADMAMWIKMSPKVLCMQRLQKPITGHSEDD